MTRTQFIAGAAGPATAMTFWVVMDQARNDVNGLTSTVHRQIRNGFADEAQAMKLMVRFHHGAVGVAPDTTPEDLFYGLWATLRRLHPERVSRISDRESVGTDGVRRTVRRVRIEGFNEVSGSRSAVTVHWVRFLGRWYIRDYFTG